MRILLATEYSINKIGGIETYIKALKRYLEKEEVKVEVFCEENKNFKIEDFDIIHINLANRFENLEKLFKKALKLEKEILVEIHAIRDFSDLIKKYRRFNSDNTLFFVRNKVFKNYIRNFCGENVIFREMWIDIKELKEFENVEKRFDLLINYPYDSRKYEKGYDIIKDIDLSRFRVHPEVHGRKNFLKATAESKIILIPSRIESFSITTLEAQYLGTIPVLKVNMGVIQATDYGKYGILNEDDKRFLEVIDFILENYDLFEKFIKRMKVKVMKRNNMEEGVKDLIGIYEDLINITQIAED